MIDQNSLQEIARQVQPTIDYAGQRLVSMQPDMPTQHRFLDTRAPDLTTLADNFSHKFISQQIAELTPKIPIISEEQAVSQLNIRNKTSSNTPTWILDPLDGTRSFVEQRDDYCINLALLVNRKAVLGIIHVPSSKKTYFGIPGSSRAWMQEGGIEKDLVGRHEQNEEATLLVSRDLPSLMLQSLKLHLSLEFRNFRIQHISAAIKFCAIAEGQADFLLGLAPTYIWDTAAGQALIEATGGGVVDNKFNAYPQDPLNICSKKNFAGFAYHRRNSQFSKTLCSLL